MNVHKITSLKPLQRGATSLLEILFVIVVACAFAVGVYRQFTTADIEKSALELNDQVRLATKLANIYYFSIDPSPGTSTTHIPIRNCNQDGSTGSTRNRFNQYEPLTAYIKEFCKNSSTKTCQVLSNDAQQLYEQMQKKYMQFFFVMGQKNQALGTPKFIGLLLVSTREPKSSDITNPTVFKLYKGKLVGNPQYVPPHTNPLSFVTSYPLSLTYGALLWIFPPSQGNLTLLDGSKLSNANMNALNNLAGAMSAQQGLPDNNYAAGCQNTYKPPAN